MASFFPDFPDSMTLGEARDRLRDLVMKNKGGAICPICNRNTKIYNRTIHATMARELIHFYRRAGLEEWFDLPLLAGEISGRRRAYTGDSAKLRYWGLMVENETRREDGGRAGWWKVTKLGESFVRLETQVPKYAKVYAGRPLRLHGKPISIIDALHDKFNYRELMER